MKVREQMLRHRAQMYAFQWNLIPVCAPADFNPDAQSADQDLNIYNEFIYNSNANKRLVFSVRASATQTTVTDYGTYYYGEEISGTMVYTTQTNWAGTITWTTGSIKRHVFYINSIAVGATIPLNAVWVYCGTGVNSVSQPNGGALKFIHTYSIYSFGSFSAGSNLTGILTIPKSVTTVSRLDSSGLTGVLVIPDGVTAIPINFMGANAFTGLVLPANLVSIGSNAFTGCTNMKGTLILPNTLTTLSTASFGGAGFTGNLIIPPLVTAIPAACFQYMSSLNGYISIHANVTSIDYDAFKNCTGITAIYNYRATPQPITADAFTSVSKSKPFHVPVGSKAAYQANQYWNLFTNIIEDL